MSDRAAERARTMAVIKTHGLTPVRIRENAKAPTGEWDPRLVVDPVTVLGQIGPEDNIAVHLHGRVVDVDVDTYDPMVPAALDHFLPPTTLVWGRPSKPASHRLYFLTSDFDRAPFSATLRALKQLAVGKLSLSVEVRGGPRSAGMVSVMPGSRHPSGETYEWNKVDTSMSPPLVDPSRLVQSVRRAGAAALLARFWTPGVRNDMSLALAGVLWRMHALAVSAAEVASVEAPSAEESYDSAATFLEAVMALSGDDEADRRTRIANLRNTWRKMERDPAIRTTGATRLAELIGSEGPDVVRRLYLLLADDPGALEFEQLADRFRIWYGQGVLVDLDLVARGISQFWMSREQAANSMGSGSLTIGGKKVLVSRLLFASLAVGRVYGVTFDPNSDDPIIETEAGALVNQWRGFKVVPARQPVSDDEVRPFLSYVERVVANGDPKAAKWVLDWCADILQDPGNKPGTSLVLVGVPGAGKTFLGEGIMGAIIGPGHYGQVNSVESLTSRFNTLVDNKVLVQCDEAVHSYQRDASARLKAIVTDKTMRVEPKYINPYVKPNHMRLLFTSNEETAALYIEATPAERRFTVLHVSPERHDDLDYWTELRLWTEANLDKIARWLTDRKYRKADIARPLVTEAKRTLQGVGVPLEVSWICERLSAGFPLSSQVHLEWWQAFTLEREHEAQQSNLLLADAWPDAVCLVALEEDYRRFVRERGKQVHTSNVWLTLRSVFPEGSIRPIGQRRVVSVDPKTQVTRRVRVRLYSFPSFKAIVEHLKRRYGEVLGEVHLPDVSSDPTEEEEF